MLNAGWRLRMFHEFRPPDAPLFICAQRRMASEDVSPGVIDVDRHALIVLNAGWRLRMFHIDDRLSGIKPRCAQRRMASEDVSPSRGRVIRPTIWCSTPDGV